MTADPARWLLEERRRRQVPIPPIIDQVLRALTESQVPPEMRGFSPDNARFQARQAHHRIGPGDDPFWAPQSRARRIKKLFEEGKSGTESEANSMPEIPEIASTARFKRISTAINTIHVLAFGAARYRAIQV
jgi:hypothetical protein